MKRYVVVAAALLSGLVGAPAHAADGRWAIAASGGGLSDPGGSGPEFATGFNVGGSIERRLGERLGLRARFGFARAEGRGAGIGGSDFERVAYGADLRLRLRRGERAVPYLFGGAGVVTLSQRIPVRDGTFRSNFTKPEGRLGAGLSHELAAGVALFAEAAGALYSFDRFGFQDETQLDLAWSAGLSYRFGR